VFYARLCWIQQPVPAAVWLLGSISAVALIQWLVRVFFPSSAGTI